MKKKAQKVDFRIFSDAIWGFTLKTVLAIHDPQILRLFFGTKNHKMLGPQHSVLVIFKSLKTRGFNHN